MDYSRIYKYQRDEEDSEKDGFQDRAEFEELESESSKGKFRKVKILMFAFMASLLVIFYVVNVMKVKSFLKEKSKLEKQYIRLDDRNQILRAKINELESPERITKIASEKFRMIKSDALPEVIRNK